jgi:hypothetical protein
VTVLVQMVSSLFGLRGTNLRWGLQVLLSTVHPELAVDAKHIAEQVLTHEVISDSMFSRFQYLEKLLLLGFLIRRLRLGSTIRVEELVRVLEKFTPKAASQAAGATGSQGNPSPVTLAVQLPCCLQRLWNKCLPHELTLTDNKSQEISKLLESVEPKAVQEIRALAAKLQALNANQVDQVNHLVRDIADRTQRSLGNLESLFNSLMDRTSQRFVTQMRLWTVVFAFGIAFGAHLDALDLFQQISSKPALRNQLVSSAEKMKQIAEKQQEIKGDQAPVVLTQVYESALAKLGEKITEVPKPYPSSFASREAVEEWLRKQVKDEAKANGAVAQYRELVDAALKTHMDKLRDQANSIQAVFRGAQLQLVPAPYHGWDFWPGWKFDNRHFWGILAFAMLLSLGAPFWFNALKTLTNLKPLLASRWEKEKQPTEKPA